MDTLEVLLPILPLLSALLTYLFSRRLHQRVSRISVAFSVLTLLVAAVVFIAYLIEPGARLLSAGTPWGSLYLDPLSTIMALAVAGISLVVHLYSVRYMAEETGYGRFFALLDLMTATILLMVAAGDLITLLVAWHLIGVLLYFLLGQNTERPAAHRYAFWTFFTYRLGDLPLVLAAVLLYQAYGTLSLPALFHMIAAAPHAHQVWGMPLLGVTALLVALAAFARSAQFPLHTWLPYTMEGPTPVSALMHAGIVNAGGFIINRFAPVFLYAGDVLHLLFAVGLFTALLGSALMLAQNDVKKALGYSTMGQMGFMIVECGVGAFSLAIYHLIAHGLFKGTLFLRSGSVINEARKDDGVPHDDMYTFVVERSPTASRMPWIVAAVLTVAAPVIILGLTHWFVAGEFVQQQGAVVLLFFGWVTGAQLLFSTHSMTVENPWRVMGMIVLSLVIVVVGYTLIEHVFDQFMYPNPAFREAIYDAAGIHLAVFDVLVGVMVVAVVAGWLATYYAAARRDHGDGHAAPFGLWVYSLFSREFYVADIYTWLTQGVLAFSRRLNVWSRWL